MMRQAELCCVRRVSVLRGRVVDVWGAPLIGVRVSVITHPLYGFTLTRRPHAQYVQYGLITLLSLANSLCSATDAVNSSNETGWFMLPSTDVDGIEAVIWSKGDCDHPVMHVTALGCSSCQLADCTADNQRQTLAYTNLAASYHRRLASDYKLRCTALYCMCVCVSVCLSCLFLREQDNTKFVDEFGSTFIGR